MQTYASLWGSVTSVPDNCDSECISARLDKKSGHPESLSPVAQVKACMVPWKPSKQVQEPWARHAMTLSLHPFFAAGLNPKPFSDQQPSHDDLV